MMNSSLLNKRALVAGSTQGIGLATAQALALTGANCTLIARNEEALKAAKSTLDTSQQQEHEYLVADFSEHEQVAGIVSEYALSKTCHILINNTGGPAAGLITEAEPQTFFRAFEQHLVVNHILAQLLIPGMRKEGYGRIINIVSTSVKIPLKGLGVSNTIRGAVASWAKTMANELGVDGITVNNVLPGATATQRLENIIQNKAQKSKLPTELVEKEMLAEIPMKRFAKPQEIAALAAFLASPSAAYITGTSIPIDGGRTGSL